MLVPDHRHIRLVVDDRRIEEARTVLGEQAIEETIQGLAQARLSLPEAGSHGTAALAVWLNLLAHRGVRVEGVFGCLPECSTLVPKDQIVDACEIVSDTPGSA